MFDRTVLRTNYVSCIKIDGEPILPPIITEQRRLEILRYKQRALVIEKRLLEEKDKTAQISSSKSEKSERCSSKEDYFEKVQESDVSSVTSTVVTLPYVPSTARSHSSRLNLSSCLLDVAEFSDSGVKVIHHNGISYLNDFQVDTDEEEVSEDSENVDEAASADDKTVSPPRLVRSNSYVLENPSPLLLAHLAKHSVMSSEISFDGPVLPKLNEKRARSPSKEVETSDNIPNRESLDKLVNIAPSCGFNVQSKMKSCETSSLSKSSVDNVHIEASNHYSLEKPNVENLRFIGIDEEYQAETDLEMDLQGGMDTFRTSSSYSEYLDDDHVEAMYRMITPSRSGKEWGRCYSYDVIQPGPTEIMSQSDYIVNYQHNSATCGFEQFGLQKSKYGYNSCGDVSVDNNKTHVKEPEEKGNVGNHNYEFQPEKDQPSINRDKQEIVPAVPMTSTPLDLSTIATVEGGVTKLTVQETLIVTNSSEKSQNTTNRAVDGLVTMVTVRNDNIMSFYSPAAADDNISAYTSRKQLEEWAASVINAGVRGYLTRRLMKTEKVRTLVQTIKDAVICAFQLHQQSQLDESDVELHRRLIQQITAVCYNFHDVFFALTVTEQMGIIAADRKRKREKATKEMRHSSLLHGQ